MMQATPQQPPRARQGHRCRVAECKSVHAVTQLRLVSVDGLVSRPQMLAERTASHLKGSGRPLRNSRRLF